MLKPPMPNLPGVGAVTDTLDFVKNLWGSMGVPGMGMAAPTLSIDDLDKKIADLKAVESWLAVNASMLRGTIQALEVQRGTIATLKSMGATLAQAVKQPGANEKSILAAAPFASAFFAHPAAGAGEPKEDGKQAEKEQTEQAQEEAKTAAADASAAAQKKAEKAQAAASDAAVSATAQLANPAAWWNMLQDQFKQAVSTAMSTDAMAGATAMAQEAAAKMTAATTRPAAQLTKTTAKSMSKPAAKPTAAPKAPAKRAAAKPRAAKPKAGKG